MHIGLIGGIGPAATDYYYKRLISAFSQRNATLELTMAHADTTTLLRNLLSNQSGSQVEIYLRLTRRLAAAGADCVVVTSIAGHFCIAPFQAVSPLPVVNMISEVNMAIAARGLKKIGILGTRTVMETRFYGAIETAEILLPDNVTAVHDAYVAMATAGVVNDDQRAVFRNESEKLMQDYGAEAILLGGTDLALAFDEKTSAFPLVDCAAIHVDALVRTALERNGKVSL